MKPIDLNYINLSIAFTCYLMFLKLRANICKMLVFVPRLASAPGTNRMASLKTLMSCVSVHGQTLTEVRQAEDKVSFIQQGLGD